MLFRSDLAGDTIETIVAALRQSRVGEDLSEDHLRRIALYITERRCPDFQVQERVLSPRRKQSNRVLGVVSRDRDSQALVQPLLRELVASGERVVHMCRRPSDRTMPGCETESLLDESGHVLPVDVLKGQLADLLLENHRVLLDISDEYCWSDVRRLISLCDVVFWLVDSRRAEPAMRVVNEFLTDEPALASRVRVVWVLAETHQAAPGLVALSPLRNGDFKVQLGAALGRPSRLQQQGIERLIRHIRGLQLGLALGGGGARGMAHLGVWKAFDLAGIHFDMVAGTSAGALVGVPYAAGYTAEQAIDCYTHDLTASRFYRWLPGGLQWYLLAKYRTGAWDKMLRKYFYDWTLEQLQVPMYTVAVDLVTGGQIVRDRGDAVHAVLESINLPGLSRPICRDGMTLVDGGVLNTLPTQVLAQRGADLVVGVSVSGKIQHEFAGNRPGTASSKTRRPSTLQTLRRVLETQDCALKAIDAQAADLLIEPDAASFDMADFGRTPQIAEAGEKAAEEAVPRLKEMVANLESQVSPQIGAPPLVSALS